MFKFLERHQIDVEKWDHCIESSEIPLIYGLSWYLDTVCPLWEALVYEAGGQYISVLPVTKGYKYGINYVYPPFFTQQLGLFTNEVTNTNQYLKEAFSLITERYNFIHYRLNAANLQNLRNVFPEGTLIRNNTNYLLQLEQPYSEIYSKYNENQRRNMKKALKAGFEARREDTYIEEVVSLFKMEKGKELTELKESNYQQLISLYLEALKRECAFIIAVTDNKGNLLAGGVFLIYHNRIIFIFGASSKEGKALGCMSLVLDKCISDFAEKPYLLDFEGSNIEGVARFYRGFGAEPTLFPEIKINKLPMLVKLFKN